MAAENPLIGQVVDRYRIERELGRGGMGVICLARHEELGRLAAVKTLSGYALADERARARFDREAVALSRVAAQGLVSIYNVGLLEDGVPYILMEYLDGQTLKQRLHKAPQGRLSVDEALAITAQLAETLAELHDRGVVHRDLKPDNIMLIADPVGPGRERTKLLDLGIAKLVEASAGATQTGIQGTPLYMAPESCLGGQIGEKVDVYSLGCVLYEMLCGRPPYLEDGGNVLLKHVHQRPVAPHRRVPELARALSAFVLELLARDPAQRPTAKETAERASALRCNPEAGLRGLRRHRGMWFALFFGMPLFLLALLILFASDSLVTRLPWPGWGRWLSRGAMVRIPGGRFTQGSSPAEREIAESMAKSYDLSLPPERRGYQSEYEEYKYLERESVERSVELPAFLMDRYEVTNEQFSRFLNDRLASGMIVVKDHCPSKSDGLVRNIKGYMCVYNIKNYPYKNLHRDPRYGGITFDRGEFAVGAEFRARPVVAVSFHAATDFCAAQNKRLPTEAEWEYAARRGGRRFPWGDRAPGCSDAVLERSNGALFSSCQPEPGRPVLPDVGSMATDRTLDGVYDMGGSVSEWTADWFRAELPRADTVVRAPREEPPAAEAPRVRVLRGGAWSAGFLSARGAARFRANEDLMHAGTGFRCVRSLE